MGVKQLCIVKVMKQNLMRFAIILVLTLFSTTAFCQKKYTLNGYIRDEASGEELIGVSIYIPNLNTGTATNAYGFYAITLPEGEYDLRITYIGYQSVNLHVILNQDRTENLKLPAEAALMDEVTVYAKPVDDNIQLAQMSRNTLDIGQVKKLPALLGESDIIKTIQLMPGVISAGEGTSSFFVRGGSGDQNLILIDEAPVYDPSHLFGLFSVFNSDVIKDSDLYKGGIPARYGGRLSGILDVRTRDGNNQKPEVTGGIGTLATRIAVEAPIVKDKSSFIVSARRSYADVFLKLADKNNLVHFYDVNAKINWKGNNRNRFYAAFYTGRDVFSFDNNFGFAWGNKTATFRWNHLFNERFFANVTAIGSHFDYKLESQTAIDGYKWTSGLWEGSIKADMTYALNEGNELNFGYHYTARKFEPGEIKPGSAESIFGGTIFPALHARDHALYAGNLQTLTPKLLLDYGIRVSIFQSVGKSDVYKYADPKDNVNIVVTDTLHYGRGEVIKQYINLEPRASLRYKLSGTESIKASYHRMVQNTHLISAATVPVPFNTWNPSSYYLRPQVADQVAIGYFRNLKNNSIEVSTEVYYKDMHNVTDFADNAEIFFNEHISTEYRQGSSWSYGAEFMANKKSGKLTGFASYTWSKAMRKIPGVNHGNPFVANYDRRHVLNLQGTYDLNPRWSFGASFTYSTGRPITLPAGKYEYGSYLPDDLTQRNGYRLPDFHRLDLSATFNPKRNDSRKWKGQWIFSVYNAYNRKNPFSIFTQPTKDADGNPVGDGTKQAKLIYLFPILPTVTYNFKF